MGYTMLENIRAGITPKLVVGYIDVLRTACAERRVTRKVAIACIQKQGMTDATAKQLIREMVEDGVLVADYGTVRRNKREAPIVHGYRADPRLDVRAHVLAIQAVYVTDALDTEDFDALLARLDREERDR